ncbi:MAG: hypothetical protein O2807_08065 [bacterium]|nr:hypothetical protein [bacterium]
MDIAHRGLHIGVAQGVFDGPERDALVVEPGGAGAAQDVDVSGLLDFCGFLGFLPC